MSTFKPGMLAALLFGGILAIAGCGAKVSDDAIAKDVQDKVSNDPTTKDSPVNVSVKDGKVTLRGTVKDAATAANGRDCEGHVWSNWSGRPDRSSGSYRPGFCPERARERQWWGIVFRRQQCSGGAGT